MSSRGQDDMTAVLRRSRTPSPRQRLPRTRPAVHAPLLSSFDVFSLIVNKMVGTGIYTNVSTVLTLTGDKGLTMTLWTLGFVYTLVSMQIYLECSAVMPYNGGELVYLDELTSSRTRQTRTWAHRVFGDGLYAYVQYAFFFLAFFNSATNCLQVGRLLLLARNPRETPDGDFLRLIAVCVVSGLCMLQYLSPESGRRLNRWMAVFKMLCLFIILCAGWHTIRAKTYAGAGFQECSPPVASQSKIQVAKAFLLVTFSFEGWENATFVAGEIDPQRPGTLRKGFIGAVLFVGIFYIALVATFLQAIPFVPIAISYTPMLFGNNTAANRAWAVLTAISSLGSVNAIIYTFSRIKQNIGSGNIIPWSEFWKSDSPSVGRTEDRFLAPKGGLVLHWVMSVVFIGASASIKTVLESVSMPALLQTYAHCVILAVMGFVVLRLPSRARHLEEARAGRHPSSGSEVDDDGGKPGWQWDLKLRDCKNWWRFGLAFVCITYGLVNLMVIVISVIPPYRDQDGFPTEGFWKQSSDNLTLSCSEPDPSSTGSAVKLTFPLPVLVAKGDAIKGWVFAVSSFGVLLLSTCYYLVVFGASQRPPLWRWGLTECAGVKPVIDKEDGYDWGLEQVRRFGRRRNIGYERKDERSEVGTLYWLGGGSRLFFSNRDRHPVRRWYNFWQNVADAWQNFEPSFGRRSD